MKRTKKSVLNASIGLMQQLVVLLVGLIVPKLFITTYGSEINGLQSSISYIYTYIALLEAGIGTATMQALYRPLAMEERDSVCSIMAATNIQYRKVAKIYLVCVIIFATIYPNTVVTTVDHKTISLMILLSSVSSLLNFLFYGKFVVLLQADGCGFVVMLASLIQYLLQNIAKIIMIAMGYPILSVYMCSAGLSVVICLIYAFYRKSHYKWLDYTVKPNFQAIAQSKNVLVHQISNIVCNSTDVLVLTYVVKNLMLVSVYNLYAMVFDAVKSIIQNVFSSVHFIMGQTYSNDHDRYLRYHSIYEVADFTVSFVLYSTAYVMILPFMEIYTKGIQDINYIDANVALMFVCIKLLTSVREPAAQVINYAGHFRKTQYRAMIEAGLNIGISIVLSYRIGIYGVLAGTIVALLYRTVDMYLYTSKYILKRSVWCSVRHWVIYMSAFSVVVMVNQYLDLPVTGYISFFFYALLVGLCMVVYYVSITCLFNFQIVSSLIKEVLCRWRKKSG